MIFIWWMTYEQPLNNTQATSQQNNKKKAQHLTIIISSHLVVGNIFLGCDVHYINIPATLLTKVSLCPFSRRSIKR